MKVINACLLIVYGYNFCSFHFQVFLGLQFAPPDIDNPYKIIRLWVHECLRIFYDRLINDKDRMWLCETLAEMLEKHFKERFGKVFSSFSHSEIKKGDASPGILKYLVAGDFMIPGADPAQVSLLRVLKISNCLSLKNLWN